MLHILPFLLLFQAAPPGCTAPVSVSEPCGGVLLPDRRARACLAAERLLEAERELRAVDKMAAEARAWAARQELEVERKRGQQCRSLLDKCARPPTPSVAWWQGPEVVVSLLVVAVGAVVAVIVLASE